eukprot:8414028-Pyramimonas_sp.AAC.1
MYKCFETIRHTALLDRASKMQFPMRLLWMLIHTYQAPRQVRAYGSLSTKFASAQGILAGCSHACAM